MSVCTHVCTHALCTHVYTQADAIKLGRQLEKKVLDNEFAPLPRQPIHRCTPVYMYACHRCPYLPQMSICMPAQTSIPVGYSHVHAQNVHTHGLYACVLHKSVHMSIHTAGAHVYPHVYVHVCTCGRCTCLCTCPYTRVRTCPYTCLRADLYRGLFAHVPMHMSMQGLDLQISLCLNLQISLCTCTYTCLCTCAYTCLHTCLHMSICVSSGGLQFRRCLHMCAHMSGHTSFSNAHVYIQVYTHVHTHVQTHVCTHVEVIAIDALHIFPRCRACRRRLAHPKQNNVRPACDR